MASTSRREQPPWTPPSSHGAPLPPLQIYNSLTKEKNQFVPIDSTGRKVTWYCCGPTVYDAGHLGHARNYVTTDVLRRILRDYFGFEVQFVQNVTDVDDKIILRARQQHLLEEFVSQNSPITPEAVSTVSTAWTAYLKKNTAAGDDVTPENFEKWATSAQKEIMGLVLKERERKLNPSAKAEEEEEVILDEKSTKLKMHLTTLHTASLVLQRTPEDSKDFWSAASSILLPYLDSLNQGREYPPEVFSKLTSYWENHFNEDMATLNVLPPTTVTRVSEFIPENVAFVKKLVDRGFAYPTADGSVYFDIAAYEAAGHHYAKLQPWNRGDESLIADGEGALTSDKASTLPNTVETEEEGKPKLLASKKTPQDFALWKAFKAEKPGEPSWDSPWGKGRPGWHIECSVMCSEVLGGQVDIHSGGIDLAFPHHDNEIAQSEAYWDGCCDIPKTADGKHQWVNYFLHMGHLSIHGSKMSKSLKNFVSIRDALTRGGWTPRGLRIVFLLGGWKDGIEVREGVLMEAKSWETTVAKFFSNVKALIAEEEEEEKKGNRAKQLFGPLEHAIFKDLDTARQSLHAALCDNFNTAAAMKVLSDLIGSTNKYMSQTKSLSAVKEISRWVTRIVTIFGLDPTSTPNGSDRIGWADPTSSTTSSSGAEEIALPYLRTLSTFRDNVRTLAIANPKDSISKDLLLLSDRLRDHDLANLGVALDDRDFAKGAPALIKFVPAEELIAAREEKERRAAEKERKKEEARLRKEEEDRKKEETARVSHLEMFKNDAEFSEWDEQGIPTRSKDGTEVTKSRRKALVKAWERQRKLHEGWLKAKGGAGA
ncbi:cysteinyl-tRNA synthetase [Choiromyces venosus 120613-1]|uniref:cysteine--tRNA ligase n=1 Tax=Choiromyces venosus 120613-1 TaxID=1336337 RepID=A0A3N4JPP9_9PEZI|nr:cysteinyl-tRNA synthetase [Choiromyces venosus 120613-1]